MIRCGRRIRNNNPPESLVTHELLIRIIIYVMPIPPSKIFINKYVKKKRKKKVPCKSMNRVHTISRGVFILNRFPTLRHQRGCNLIPVAARDNLHLKHNSRFFGDQ